MKFKKTALLRASVPLMMSVLSIDSFAQELVYVPLAENCRIVDTNGSAGNSLAHGTSRAFYAWGETDKPERMADQGGSSACILPEGRGRPAAIAAGIIAVGQFHGSNGNLVVYSDGTKEAPSTSMVNFKGNNIANAGVVNLAVDGSMHDFYVKANVFKSSKDDKRVRVIVDVVGYYYPIKKTRLHHVITVSPMGGDFADPIAALASINDATADDPYLIKIGPGKYDLGSNQMVMKPYVRIQGAGRGITRLVGDQGSVVTTSPADAAVDPLSSLLIGASYAALEDLSVENVGEGKEARAAMYNFDASPEVSRVELLATGTTKGVCGMQNYGTSAPVMIDVNVEGISTRSISLGGGVGGGVCNTDSTQPMMNNVKAKGMGTLGCGVCNAGASAPQMVDVHAIGMGGASYGIQNVDNASPGIWQSILEGSTAALTIAPGGITSRVVDSLIVGPVVDGRPSSKECLRINDVSLNELSC